MIKKYVSLFLLIVLSILSGQSFATTYETIGNNSWTPSNPSSYSSSSDHFIINHRVTISGITLNSGGSLTVNAGGDLTIKSLAVFNLGSSVVINNGGKLTMTQLTASNYSADFIINGEFITENGTIVNYPSGVITYNQDAYWTMNQLTLTNHGSLFLYEDANWKNGTVSFIQGNVVVNSHLVIKNMTLSNSASIVGVGQIEVANGRGTFSSTGTINDCSGPNCIPPSTIGSITYLSYHSVTPGNTFVPYSGGNLPSTGCTTTIQALEDLTISSDVVIGDLVISPNVKVLIEPGASLSICAGIVNEGMLMIENTASLVQSSATNINEGSGKYIIDREGSSNPLSFNSWSSPITTTSFDDVFRSSNPCDIFCFEGATQTWKYDYPVNYQASCNGNQVTFGSSIVINNGDGIMDIGRGYFVPGEVSVKRTFTGTVNNAEVIVPVYETSVGNNPNWNLDDWNLIGNPYPSAINLAEFYAQNAGVLTGDFYFWIDDNSNGTTYNHSNDYAVYNDFTAIAANGSNLPTQYIGAGQGFWVYASQNGNVKFNNSMRVTGNNTNFYKTDDNVVVWIDITNDSNNFNQTAIGYSNTSTDTFDVAQDAPKGESNAALSFGSMIDSNIYSIQAFEELANYDTRVTPLFVSTVNTGIHTFSLSSSKNVWDNMFVSVRDNSTGLVTDLKNSDFSILLSAGVYDSRFELIMERRGAPSGISETPNLVNNLKVYQNDEFIYIQTKGAENLIESVQLFDVSGKSISSSNQVNQASFQLSSNGLNSGVYFIKATLNNGLIETHKLVILD
jgi:hypothetical protein